MTCQYILAIDQGTTGTTAVILDVTNPSGYKVVSQTNLQIKQYYPKEDWVEHDLDDIWDSTLKAIRKSIEEATHLGQGFQKNKIIAIGITNQRETLCVFDRKSKKPLSKAIVWQCKRSQSICKSLKDQGIEEDIIQRTGLVLDPYFTGTKIKWLMDNNPAIKSQMKTGSLCLSTIDSFIVHQLTDGASFVTEPSNASRTLLYNIKDKKWDTTLLGHMGITNSSVLPKVCNSSDLFGKTKGLDCLPDGIPITAVLGDQQAALAGQGGFHPFDVKCTYGTGAFLLQNTGEKVVHSAHGLLTTVAWSLDDDFTYALEGSCFIAGAAVQFLKENLNLITSSRQTSKIPSSTVAAPHIYFVPSLAGLGAPWWEPKCKGAMFGLTRSSSKEQIIKATLEGIALQVQDVLAALADDTGVSIKELKVDGGAAANDLLMNLQADFSQTKILRPRQLESTAIGVGLLAGLKVGLYSKLTDIEQAIDIEQTFVPEKSKEADIIRHEKLSGWKRAVQAVKMFSS